MTFEAVYKLARLSITPSDDDQVEPAPGAGAGASAAAVAAQTQAQPGTVAPGTVHSREQSFDNGGSGGGGGGGGGGGSGSRAPSPMAKRARAKAEELLALPPVDGTRRSCGGIEGELDPMLHIRCCTAS